MLKLGIHVSSKSKVLNKSKSLPIHSAISRDTDILDLNSVQIFTHGPRNKNENKLDYKQIKNACKNLDLTVHSTYMSVAIWKVSNNNKNTKISKEYIKHITDQLETCKKIGAWGLVIHISKNEPSVIADTMKILKPIAKTLKVKIILEMVSAKASGQLTYETPEKINYLTELIGLEKWWCWCIDTAHLWGAGINVKKYKDMKKWFGSIKYKKKIGMIHLNGSSANLGSGDDKHEIPFTIDDKIWYNILPKKSGLRTAVEFAMKHDCTIICEINRGEEEDTIKSLDIIKDLSGL